MTKGKIIWAQCQIKEKNATDRMVRDLISVLPFIKRNLSRGPEKNIKS